MSKTANVSFASIIGTILYLIVHFITDFGGADVMGAQWLYTSVLDLIIVLYIYLNKSTYKSAITSIYTYRFTLVFSFLLLWAISSYFYAINPTESLVCLARLSSTYLIFINLSILYYKQNVTALFNAVSILVALVLLYDALGVIAGFSKNIESMNLDQNIISLMGNNGNKNVMAASLLIKFPFVLYVILNNKLLGKILGMICLYLGIFALFILNTRSTYVGLALIFIIYTVSSFYFKSNYKKISYQVAYFLIPIIIAFFSANVVLDNAVKIQGFQGGYGTVTKRAGDITIASEKSSRLHLWEAAIDYAVKHPIRGAGYGNWKLASIPYEKEYTNDLFVPYHSHNDFLEMFADLGVVGGVSFALLFLIVLLFTIQVWRDKEMKEYSLVATISFMAIACYAVDALLNFPAERTSMQTMLAVSSALVFLPASFIKNQKGSISLLPKHASGMFLLIGLVLIIPSIYIANQTFESLKVQKYVMGEIDSDPKMALDEVQNAFPSIPNLSTSTLPIKALVARYYFRDKKYDEALQLLNESENVNPYLHYNDFIRTAIYADKKMFDSVSYYSKRAFYNWPRATSYYKNVMFGAAKQKDTVELNKAFNLYKKYRNDGAAWNQYLLAMYEVKGGVDDRLKWMLDSAVKSFPQDSVLFLNVRSLYGRQIVSGNGADNPVIQAMNAFKKGAYAKAAQLYIQLSQLEPTNYTHFENAGICFYSSKNYKQAIEYFEKAGQFSTEQTGKSEFFKAMSYIAIGNKAQACSALQVAKQKNYPQIDTYIAQNCK